VTPNNKGPVSAEYRDNVNKNYDEFFKKTRRCPAGFGFDPVPADYTTFSVSEEEREKAFEATWNHIYGLAFAFASFSDIMTNEAANRELCKFFRKKIAQIVQDPEKREKLMPPPEALCDAIIKQTVYYGGESYFFSDYNTVRKPKVGRHVLWFIGGYDKYVDKVQEAVEASRGFTFVT
jgi:hypothetical protein